MRDGTPVPSRPAGDASAFRARWERAYPNRIYTEQTEVQAFGYAQHIGRMMREEAELAADLQMVRLAPLFGVKLAGL